MATAKEVGKELTDLFSTHTFNNAPVTVNGKDIANDPHFDAYGFIGSILSDEQAVLNGLGRLDQTMTNSKPPSESDLRAPYPITSNSSVGKRFVGFLSNIKQKVFHGGYLQEHNILTDALDNAESLFGFGKAVTLTTAIAPGTFASMVKQGQPFKDPGVGTKHGEYTHRIQWFILMTAAGNNVLFNSKPGDVYKQIGEWVFDGAVDTGTNKSRVLSVWDALFDRSTDANLNPFPPASAKDFRSPENLQAYIIDGANEVKFPVLHAVIVERAKSQTNFNAAAFIADKCFETTIPILEMQAKKKGPDGERARDRLQLIANNVNAPFLTDTDDPIMADKNNISGVIPPEMFVR